MNEPTRKDLIEAATVGLPSPADMNKIVAANVVSGSYVVQPNPGAYQYQNVYSPSNTPGIVTVTTDNTGITNGPGIRPVPVPNFVEEYVKGEAAKVKELEARILHLEAILDRLKSSCAECSEEVYGDYLCQDCRHASIED